MSKWIPSRLFSWLPVYDWSIWLLVLALALLFYRGVWRDVPTLVQALDHCPELFCDFTRQYYPTGQALFTTGQPTNGYFYTTVFALFMALFGQWGLETAVWLWGACQVAAVLLLFGAGYDLLDRSQTTKWLYWLFLLFSLPVWHNLKWGQVSLFVTGCIWAALALYRRGYGWAAMGVLAVGTAVKYYAAFFLLYFLFKREWRLLLLFGLFSGLLIFVLPLLFLGYTTNVEFYRTVSERIAHARTTWMPTDINSQYLVNVITRLRAPQPVSAWLWRGVGLFLTGINLLCAWRGLRRQGDAFAPLFFGFLFLSLPLFLETSWPHYFVYLPLVQVLAVQGLRRTAVPRWARWVGWGLVLLSLLVASTPFFALWESWKPYEKAGMLFWANGLMLLFWYLGQSARLPQS